MVQTSNLIKKDYPFLTLVICVPIFAIQLELLMNASETAIGKIDSEASPQVLAFGTDGKVDNGHKQIATQNFTAPGKIVFDPSGRARLTAKATGTIWRVYKELGEPVRKDEILALIDASNVGKAKADFLLSLTQFELRDTELNRIQTIAQTLPEKDISEADEALQEARIKLSISRQSLLNLGFSIHLNELADRPSLDRIRFMQLLGLPDELKNSPDAQSLTSNLLPICAPFDGHVVELDANVGESVDDSHSRVLFDVADLHKLQIEVQVKLESISDVFLGQKITFQPSSGGREAEGIVSRISPQVEANSQCVRVLARVTNADTQIRANTIGVGTFFKR